MTTMLIGESGTPVIDAQGNLISISGDTEMKQRIANVFSTQKNSETLFLEYGFDTATLLRGSHTISPSLLLRSLAVDALNPKNVEGLNTLYGVETMVSGGIGFVSLTVKDDDGIKFTESLSLYTGES